MHNNRSKYIKFVFFTLFFVLFTLSYSINFFHICEDIEFKYYDRLDEINIITRLDKSAREGMFSDGGLTGHTKFIPQSEEEKELDFVSQVSKQYHRYVNNQPINGKYSYTYKSQPGGQAMLFALVQKVLPFDNENSLRAVKLLNSMLLSVCFLIFLSWVYRNFNFTTSLITFLFLLLSPWLTKVGHNIWWALWSFYIPFLAMLLVFEQNNKNRGKYSEKKVFLIMYLAVFLKCFFTGFEFMPTTLVCIFCPIFYYMILERRKLKEIVFNFLRNGIAAVLGVLTIMVMLIFQIRSVDGSFKDGLNHIIFSYSKRATFEYASEYGGSDIGFLGILKKYLIEDFPFPIETFFGINVTFLGLFIIILLSGILILVLENTWKNKVLLYTALFSMLAPLSWFLIFKQHATTHSFVDYIVWYIPTLLYGFVIIGKGVSLVIYNIKKKIIISN